jgi:uncharacterized membrane protein
MTTLIKLFLGIYLVASIVETESKSVSNYEPIDNSTLVFKDPTKAKAFEVLTNKCNVCHEKRNRRRVFTEENMNGWSADVYKQVFLKKRMPKGNKIKLTSTEYQDLLTWITSTKNK